MRLRLILALLLFPLSAQADLLLRPNASGIADLANLLPAPEERELESAIADIKATTGVQLVVITIGRIEDVGAAGRSLETFSTDLFNKIGIGDATRNDGVLLLVAVNDRAMRIELGKGFSSTYDSRAQVIIDETMLPKFRREAYARGILDGVAGIKAKIAQPFAEGRWVGVSDNWPGALVLLGLAGGAFGLFRGGRALYLAYKRCPKCGQTNLQRQSEVLEAATYSSSGSGVTHVSCPDCGFREDRPYTIAMKRVSSSSSSRSSGGGGGFGGGSSRGGGASGRW